MEEEVKAIRTMKQFAEWYERNYQNIQPTELSLQLNEFYIKFKYIIKQEEEETNRLAKFLG
jgi:hypothetical protein